MPHVTHSIVEEDTAVSGGRPPPDRTNDWPALVVGGVFIAVWASALLLTFYYPQLIRYVVPFALMVIAPLALLDCGVVVLYWVRKRKMSVPARVATLLPLSLVVAAVLAADGL